MINDATLSTWTPRVLSAMRIITALLFLQHGLAKFFGWPAPGPANLQMFSLIGLAGALEIVGGALLTIGLFSRVVAFIVSGEMAVAYFMGHAPNSFFPLVNRGEAAIMFCFIFLYVAFAGPGPWSLDATRDKSS